MALSGSDKTKLLDLLERLHEGRLAEQEMRWLEQTLATNADARELHARYFLMTGLLRWNGSDRPQQAAADQMVTLANEEGSWWRRSGQTIYDFASSYWALSLLVSSLAMTIMALSMALIVPEWEQFVPSMEAPPTEFVARVVVTKDARWSSATEIVDRWSADLYVGQTIELKSGVAEILFDSGATVVLEGPATFRALGELQSELLTGKLVARVPPEAIGFTVDTPLMTVVDLGTEFALDVNAEMAEVHVFEGSTRVTPGGMDDPQVVSAGEAVRFMSSSSGQTQSSRIAIAHRFIQAIESATRVARLLGADTGEGLDLQGEFAYAVNVGGPSVMVGDVEFVGSDDVPELQFAVNQKPFTWDVSIGDSAADQGLSQVLSSLLFSRAPQPVTASMPVTVGQEYRLQLLFTEGLHRDREFRITVNGKTIVSRLTISPGDALVVKHLFVADSDHIKIELVPVDVGLDTDTNPIFPAFTLEKLKS